MRNFSEYLVSHAYKTGVDATSMQAVSNLAMKIKLDGMNACPDAPHTSDGDP